MKRIIQLIKKYFQKNKYTEEQKLIFDQIVVGDIIFAKLSLPPEKEKTIEDSHLHRPFLVAKKGKNEVYAYVFSSVKRNQLHSYDYYKQPFLFNNNSKPSYIYLNNLQKIPIENIHKILKHMDEITLMRLDKRLFIASNHGFSRPRFNMHLFLEKGDIVKHEDQLYLVVSRNEENVIVNKVYQDLSEEKDVIVIKNKEKVYLIQYKEDITLSATSGFIYVDLLFDEDVKKIRFKANKEREKHNDYYFRYPIGLTFSVGMNDYLYLYHKGKNSYGITFNDESYNLNIVKLCDMSYMKKGIRFDTDEVKYVLELIIEQGKDIHGVVHQILDRM